MSYLIDTNVLLRSVQTGHGMHLIANQAIKELKKQKEELVLVAQNLYEFWTVATRPLKDNGLGMTIAEVSSEFLRFRRFFIVLGDVPTILDEWESLVANHAVLGKNGHDARLVAAMKTHGLSHLLTFNEKDFQRFAGITIQTPHAIYAGIKP